jgi:RND superfamily putative drug exporter
VRWPAPIFAVSAAVVLVGMVALPGFKTSYNDRHYLPETAPSNIGYAAADPALLRSPDEPGPADDRGRPRHAQHRPTCWCWTRSPRTRSAPLGIAMIQDITRPLGIPIQHSSIPFQNSIQSQTTMQNMDFLKDRMKDILKMADEMQIMIET